MVGVERLMLPGQATGGRGRLDEAILSWEHLWSRQPWLPRQISDRSRLQVMSSSRIWGSHAFEEEEMTTGVKDDQGGDRSLGTT